MLTEFIHSLIKRAKIYAKILKTQPLSLTGIIIILSFVVIALLAPVLAPPVFSDPYMMPYTTLYPPPSWMYPRPTLPTPEYPFGTLSGYDLFYGCIWGVRMAFYIGILTTLIAIVIGLSIGSIAGYFEGIIDEILMRFTDAFFAIPGLAYVLLVVMAMPLKLELNLGFLNLVITVSRMERIILALAIIGWPPHARLIRGEMKRIKQQDFVEAAKAIGCSRLRILAKHILPNSLTPLLTLAFLNIGGVILVASTVSFLGFGPAMGYSEWGSILASAQSYLIFSTESVNAQFAFLVFIPAVFLSMFVLGWSLLGDALTYAIDPILGRRL